MPIAPRSLSPKDREVLDEHRARAEAARSARVKMAAIGGLSGDVAEPRRPNPIAPGQEFGCSGEQAITLGQLGVARLLVDERPWWWPESLPLSYVPVNASYDSGAAG